MLVIRRRPGESVIIEAGPGVRIQLQVMEVQGARVKLGFAAPASVLILRQEILVAAEQNRAAAESVTASSVAALLDQLRGWQRGMGAGAEAQPRKPKA